MGFSTKYTKPSRIRRAEDEYIARQQARLRKFADYDDSLNPWFVGSLRYERVKRAYERIVQQYRAYEPIFQDICRAYGYTPPAL